MILVYFGKVLLVCDSCNQCFLITLIPFTDNIGSSHKMRKDEFHTNTSIKKQRWPAQAIANSDFKYDVSNHGKDN